MAKSAPNPIDVQEFQFKLHCRLKVFDNEATSAFNKPCNLLSAASLYGLIFVGSVNPSFQIIQISSIEKHVLKETSLTDYSCRTIQLPSPPKYLDVNCDNTKLAVVVEKNRSLVALIFDVLSMLKLNLPPPIEIILSATPNVSVTQTNWNPAIPNIYTVCKDDGSLGSYELKGGGIEINQLPMESQATCFSWSPKGKQIAVGARNGTITQYKPDLKAVKIINAPPLEGACSAVALQWISNYLFAGLFKLHSGDAASLITIEAPKVGNVVYTNYDDICYSYGNSRPVQFYMIFQNIWNTLMVASSNSIEIGVLGCENDQWTQWILGDSARAELPLSASKQETVPIGLAFDNAAVDPVVWGETYLPPAPFLLMLSHQGLLCCFRAINMKTSAPNICQAPQSLPDTSGLSQFINVSTIQTKPSLVIPTPAQQKELVSSLSEKSEGLKFDQQPLFKTPTSLFQPQIQSQFSGSKSEPVPILKPPPKLFNLPTTGFPQLQSPNVNKPEQQVGFKSDPNAQQTLPDNRFQNLSQGFAIQNQQPTLANVPFSRIITAELPKPSPSDKQINLPPSVTITPVSKSRVQVQEAAKESALSSGEPTIAPEDANILISKLIREECEALEIELKALLQKGSTLKVEIGTDKEAGNLVNKADELCEFLKEITETNSAQSAEIHSLKQGLIQTWAWYEDARSRYAQAQDPTLETLLRIQQLDPVSQRYKNEMNHMTYYLESQLMQAGCSLDEQWENFQDSCKKVSRLKIPTMEAIYQTMVRQSAIFEKQKYVLKDISQRIRSNSSKAAGTSFLISLNNANNLEKELKRLQLEPECWLQAQYERVVQNNKNLTDTKVRKLRNLLENRKITRVSVGNPQLFNKSLQMKLQASIKNKTSGFSPIAEKIQQEPRILNFNTSDNKLETTGLTITKVPVFSTSVVQPLAQTQSLNFSMSAISNSNQSTMKPKFNFTQTSTPTMFTSTPFSVSTPAGNAPQTMAKTMESSKLLDLLSSSTSMPNVTSSQLANTKSTSSAFALATQPSFNFNSKSSAPNIFSSIAATGASTTPFSFEGVKSVSKNSFVPNTTSVVVVSSVAPVVTSETSKSQLVATTASLPSTLFKFSTEGVPGQNIISSLQFSPVSSASPGASKPVGIASVTSNAGTTFDAPKTSFSFGATSKPASSSLSDDINKSVNTSKSPFMFGNAQNVSPTSALDSKSTGGLVITPIISAKTDQNAPQLSATEKTSSIFGNADVSSSTDTYNTFKFGSGTTASALPFGATNATSANLVTASSGSSIFSSVSAKSESSGMGSIFQSNSSRTTASSSIFGNTATNAPFSSSPAVTTSSSMFGGALVTTPSSIFGAPITTSSSMFGTSVTTPSGSIFGVSSVTSSSLFGTAADKTTDSVTIVSTSNPIPVQSPSAAANTIFNNSITAVTPPSSPVVSTATPTSLFKSPQILIPVPTTSTSAAPFGGSSSASFFSTTPAASSNSLFSATVASSAPAFGASTLGNTNTTTTMFAQAPVNTSTTAMFAQAPANSNASSIFGTTTVPPGGLFGSTTAPTSKPSTFGFGSAIQANTTTATTTSGSPFGQPAAFQSGSLFNTPTAPPNNTFGTNKSIFGSPSTVANEAKPASSFSFATAAANVSTNPSVFGTSSQPAFGFGSATTNTDTSSFGFGSLNVQQSATTLPNASFGSGFGQQANSNPFGKAPQEKPGFGSGNLFAKANTTNSSSIFGGSANSTFGSAPVFGSSPGFGSPPPPAFGQQSTFNQNSFGGGFGSPQPAGPFNANQPSGASGPFSTGNQSVAQTGFGGFGQVQKPSGFGSPPVFGGSPGGFGSPPAFGGGNSTFGGNSSFGSPQIPFGEPVASTGGFGAQKENSTFANLANQPTLGFGSLAQQSQTNPGMSSFSGGSSFSTWR